MESIAKGETSSRVWNPLGYLGSGTNPVPTRAALWTLVAAAIMSIASIGFRFAPSYASSLAIALTAELLSLASTFLGLCVVVRMIQWGKPAGIPRPLIMSFRACAAFLVLLGVSTVFSAVLKFVA